MTAPSAILSAHRQREHAARDVLRLEAVLQEDARGDIGALAGAADDVDLPAARQLAQARAELAQRNVQRSRHGPGGDFRHLADIEQEALPGAVPVNLRHIAAKRVRCGHAREVHRVLGAAELRRVAKLGLLQIVDRRVHLDGHRERADALVDIVLAEGLRAEHAARRTSGTTP